MPIEISWRVVLFGVVVLGYLLATNWTERIRRLFGLTFFRPWRGDPWPRGVQEGDPVHWRWHERPTVRDEPPLTVHTERVHPTIGRAGHP